MRSINDGNRRGSQCDDGRGIELEEESTQNKHSVDPLRRDIVIENEMTYRFKNRRNRLEHGEGLEFSKTCSRMRPAESSRPKMGDSPATKEGHDGLEYLGAYGDDGDEVVVVDHPRLLRDMGPESKSMNRGKDDRDVATDMEGGED